MKRNTCFSNQQEHFTQSWCTPVGKLFIDSRRQCILSQCLDRWKRRAPRPLIIPMAKRAHWSRFVMSMVEFSPQIKEDTSSSYFDDYTNLSQVSVNLLWAWFNWTLENIRLPNPHSYGSNTVDFNSCYYCMTNCFASSEDEHRGKNGYY